MSFENAYLPKPGNDIFARISMKALASLIDFLDSVLQALKKRQMHHPSLLEFWKGLPRDTEGRWQKYHIRAPHYYVGYKPMPTTSDADVRFLRANIRGARFFLESFPQIRRGLSNKKFFEWYIQLHKKQTYTPSMGGKILTKQIANKEAHTPMVADDVCRLAKKYNDPYTDHGTQILTLAHIPTEGLPKDIWSNSTVIHVYPDPRYYPYYIRMINKTLTDAIHLITSAYSLKEKLAVLALFYQYAVNSRMFKKTNHSLALNVCNTFLRELGLHVIESGILDFVAMRLRPTGFAAYFIEEVARVNPTIVLYSKKAKM